MSSELERAAARYRRYFDTYNGSEILVHADGRHVSLVIDRDDDGQVCEIQFDRDDAAKLHTLLGEALSSLKAPAGKDHEDDDEDDAKEAA